MKMVKIKNGFAKMLLYSAHIYGYVLYFNDKYVLYKPIYENSTYQGFALCCLDDIYKIVYKSKILDFYKIVMRNDDTKHIKFESPKELIEYCYRNNKCIEINKRQWGDGAECCYITNVFDDYFEGKAIDKNGRLREKIISKFKDITVVQYDTVMLRNFEKILY